MRVIGMDVSRTFAELAYLEEGLARPGGRVGLHRDELEEYASHWSPRTKWCWKRPPIPRPLSRC